MKGLKASSPFPKALRKSEWEAKSASSPRSEGKVKNSGRAVYVRSHKGSDKKKKKKKKASPIISYRDIYIKYLKHLKLMLLKTFKA